MAALSVPSLPVPVSLPAEYIQVIGFASFVYFYYCVFGMHEALLKATDKKYPLGPWKVLDIAFYPRLLALLICMAWADYARLIPIEWQGPSTMLTTAVFLMASIMAVIGDMRWSYNLSSCMGKGKGSLPFWLPGLLVVCGYLITPIVCRVGLLLTFAALFYLRLTLTSRMKDVGSLSLPEKEPFLISTDALKERYEPLFFRAVIPIATATICGGIISAIWLAVLGEYPALAIGAICMFVLPWALYVLLLPALLLRFVSRRAADNKPVVFTVDFLGLIYIYFLAAVYCASCLSYFPTIVKPDSMTPALIWSYTAAVLPCIGVAHQQQDDLGSMICLLFMELNCLGLVIATPFYHLDGYQQFGWLATGLLIVAFFQALSGASGRRNIDLWPRKERPKPERFAMADEANS